MGHKNVCIAYLLWLFGGVWGFHHLYLGRYRHALVWYCTGMYYPRACVCVCVRMCAMCVGKGEGGGELYVCLALSQSVKMQSVNIKFSYLWKIRMM